VLSPSKDDKGDYLESGRDDKDDSKRLKRVFFETYLESSKADFFKVAMSKNPTVAPEVIT
jgi:hypothetical protein